MQTVILFKYLGRVLTAEDDNWPAVTGTLRKYRNIWMRMTKILSREGADPKVSGFFLKAVVQAVLLFGAEMWVLTPWMERALSTFQHRVVRQLNRSYTRRRRDGRWDYLPLA